MAPCELVREGVGYLPTYLRDDKRPSSTGEVTLFVRRFRITRGLKTRKLHLKATTDVWVFPNDEEMVAAIEERGAFELPAEADGDPRYVPEDWRV